MKPREYTVRIYEDDDKNWLGEVYRGSTCRTSNVWTLDKQSVVDEVLEKLRDWLEDEI